MKKLILIAAPLCVASSAFGQVSFAGTYTQNFDSLPTTSSVTWTNLTTLNGWIAATDATSSITSIGVNTGSTTTAGLYSFGVTGTNTTADRALGYAPSNAFTGGSGTGRGAFGLYLTNTSGQTLQNFNLSYRGEQFRKDNALAQGLTVGYSVGTATTATGMLGATTTDIAGLTFTTPNLGTGGAIDGNAAANSATVSSTLTGLTLTAGQTVLIRWVDLNDSGNDHFIAIDDVSITADAVPEPATMTILAGAAAIAALRRKRK